MGAANTQLLIEERVIQGWTDDDVNLRTPLALPNTKGLLVLVDTTDDEARIPNPPSDPKIAPWYGRWMRMSIREQGNGAANLGRELLARKIGRVTFQIFVPVGVGTITARTLGDQAVALLRGIDFGPFEAKFDTGEDDNAGREVGPTPDGKWWQYNCSVPYFRDDYVDLDAP